MTKLINDKTKYGLLILVMGIFLYLLNFCIKVSTCSLMYTLMMYTLYLIYKEYGKKRAIFTLTIYIIINLFCLKDYTYSFSGKTFDNLILYSFIAVLLSGVALVISTSCLETKLTKLKSLFSGLVIAAFVDGITMFIYFLYYLPLEKCFDILYRECLYKTLYSFILISVLYSVNKISVIKKRRNIHV